MPYLLPLLAGAFTLVGFLCYKEGHKAGDLVGYTQGYADGLRTGELRGTPES